MSGDYKNHLASVKEPIKIIHIITGLEQGGAENMLYNLLAHTDKAKFENVVIP